MARLRWSRWRIRGLCRVVYIKNQLAGMEQPNGGQIPLAIDYMSCVCSEQFLSLDTVTQLQSYLDK
jgi:hypothetical protein